MKNCKSWMDSKLISAAAIFMGLSLISAAAFAEDQWFCKEGASRSLGDVMESCGIGKSKDESEARKKALEGAFDEFDRICRESVTCRDYEKTVEPMRTECIKGKSKEYTCYRALDFTVTHQKKDKAFDDKDKKDALVTAIAKNTDSNTDTETNKDSANNVNAALANTTNAAPSIYRNSHPNYDPYIYIISSQPRIVYVQSQLPPQYVPAPAPPPVPAPPKQTHTHQNHPNKMRLNSPIGVKRKSKKESFPEMK